MQLIPKRQLAYYLFPYLLVALAFWLAGPVMSDLLAKGIDSQAWLRQIKLSAAVVQQLPWLVLAVAAFLSFHFNRTRSLLCALVFLLFQGYLQFKADTTAFAPEDLSLAFSGLLLWLTALALLPERSMWTLQGGLLLGGLIFGVLWLTYGPDLQSLSWLVDKPDWLWLSPLLTELNQSQHWYAKIPFAVMTTWLISATVLLLLLIRRKSASYNILLVQWLVMSLVYINWSAYQLEPVALAWLLSAAGLVLLLGVLQDSYNMAYRDEMTGLLGRRALEEQLLSLGRQYSIAMVDVDHFKSFNDTYGHDVGDQVLKMVATHLRHTGGGAKAYRYGGEEFTLLFPGKQISAVMPHLEVLRATIADYAMTIRQLNRPKKNKDGKSQRKRRPLGSSKRSDVSVTVSIGVAEKSREIANPSEVIKAADQALYQAKKQGRNRVNEARKIKKRK